MAAEEKGDISKDSQHGRVDVISLPSASSPLLSDRPEEDVDATQPSYNLGNRQNNERIEMVTVSGAATDKTSAPAPAPTSTSWKKKLIVIVAILVFLVLLSMLIWFFASKKPTVPAPTTQTLTTTHQTTTPTTNHQTTTEKNVGNGEKFWRIHGGKDSKKDDWPWQVLIAEKSYSMSETLGDGQNIRGGGSIINKHWILTAAHVAVDEEADKWAIFVGVHERPDEGEKVPDSVKAFNIEEWVVHPNFTSKQKNNDIALIKLGSELDLNMKEVKAKGDGLTFSSSVKPVCLPCIGTGSYLFKLKSGTDEANSKGKCENEEKYLLSGQEELVVTGFGSVRQSDDIEYTFVPPQKLQKAQLKFEDKQTCQKSIETILNLTKKESKKYMESIICCSPRTSESNADACTGDSGGPIVKKVSYYVKDGNTKVQERFWVQVGIVSFGIGCGRKNTPGHYTNVVNFISWINSTTNGAVQGPALDLTVVSLDGTATSAKVSWKLSKAYKLDPPRIKEYNLYYIENNSSTWSHKHISGGTSTTNIEGLLQNKVYRFMIKATTTEGVTLPPSRVVSYKNFQTGQDRSDCEDGDIYYGGYCFWFDTTRRTFAASQAECESRHSTTGYVINSNHYDIIMDKIREAMPSDTEAWWFWIGLRCNPSTGAVTIISDTQEIPFVKWRYSQPTSMARKTNIYLQVEKDASSAYNGMENNYDFYKAGVICQYKSL